VLCAHAAPYRPEFLFGPLTNASLSIIRRDREVLMHKAVKVIGKHPDKGCEGEVVAAGNILVRVALGASRRIQTFQLGELTIL
jgi:hypothetical protein